MLVMTSKLNEISAGVRQGCVLSPRLFCAVLPGKQRVVGAMQKKGTVWICRMVCNICWICGLRMTFSFLRKRRTDWYSCWTHFDLLFGKCWPTPKCIKTNHLDDRPPIFLRTRRGEQVTVLDFTGSHKLLGCMLTSKSSKSSNIDIEYHLQPATKVFYANKTVLCDKHVSICKRLRYFHTVVTPVACFGAGPGTIHGVDLSKLDLNFLHACNERVNYVV